MVDFDTWTSDYSQFPTTLPCYLDKSIYKTIIFVQTLEIQIVCLLTRFC